MYWLDYLSNSSPYHHNKTKLGTYTQSTEFNYQSRFSHFVYLEVGRVEIGIHWRKELPIFLPFTVGLPVKYVLIWSVLGLFAFSTLQSTIFSHVTVCSVPAALHTHFLEFECKFFSSYIESSWKVG